MSDAMKRAMNAKYEPPKQVYFGDIEWQMRDVVFVQDENGKWSLEPYDPELHENLTPDVEISITLYPLEKDFRIERTMQAQSRKRPDWSKVTLPSLQKLGIQDLNAIYRQFVQVEMVKSGSYVDKDGERKDRTAMKFLKVFPNREACQQAADEYFKSSNGNNNGNVSASHNNNGNGNSASDTVSEPTPAPAQPADGSDNPMRTFAVQSLASLWEASKKNYNEFAHRFSQNPVYEQVGLTLRSPEVVVVTGVGTNSDDEIPF